MMNTKKMRMIDSTLPTDKIDNVNSPHFTVTTVSFHGRSSLHGHSSRTMLRNKDRHTIKNKNLILFLCFFNKKEEEKHKHANCYHAACMQHLKKQKRKTESVTKPSRSHTHDTTHRIEISLLNEDK